MNQKMIADTISEIKQKLSQLEQLLIKKFEIFENKTIYSNVFQYKGEYILLSELENYTFDDEQIEVAIYLNKEIIQFTLQLKHQTVLEYLQSNLSKEMHEKLTAAITFTKSLTPNINEPSAQSKEKIIKLNLHKSENTTEFPKYQEGILYNVLNKLNKIKVVRTVDEAKQIEQKTKELQPNYTMYSTYTYAVAAEGEKVFQFLSTLNDLEQIVFVDEDLKDELWITIMKYELEKFVFVNKKKIKISEFD